MNFEIVAEIEGIETFALGRSIREPQRIQKIYGKGRWQKRKGFATVRFPSGAERVAEIHWYEATGHKSQEIQNHAFFGKSKSLAALARTRLKPAPLSQDVICLSKIMTVEH